MSIRYHVYRSDDDSLDDGGVYKHAKTFDDSAPGWKADMFEFAGRLLDKGKAVQILPETTAK